MITSFRLANIGNPFSFCLYAAAITALSCSDPPVVQGPPPGAIRGDLVVYVADYDDGRTQTEYYLRVGGEKGKERRLILASSPDLPAGSSVDVWGQDSGEDLLVSRFAPVVTAGPVESHSQALINGTPYRPKRLAFVLVDMGAGVNLTPEVALRRLMGLGATDASLRQYYIEASFGRQDLAAQVFGPIKATMTGCDTRDLATALRDQVPQGFDHYLWYMGSRVAACPWTGLAAIGSPDRPARDTWYNASTNCVVLVQEPGHNFGMKHSSSLKCTGGAFSDDPMANCVHTEYGDSYDPMGRACRHTNAYQKAYQGWFAGCNMVDVYSTGTFTLLPIELPCNGAQALQIPMPRTRPFFREGGGGAGGTVNLTHYYVEMRASQGFDRGLPPQVQIRVSGDIRQRNQGGINTWFLDMNPATPALDGLVAGGSYTDPNGELKITVESIDTASATIKVEVPGAVDKAPTCMDGTTFAASGPAAASCAAAPSVPGDVLAVLPDGGARPAPDGGVVIPARDAATTLRDGSFDLGARGDTTFLAQVADVRLADTNGSVESSTLAGGAADAASVRMAPGVGDPMARDASLTAALTPVDAKKSSSGCGCDLGKTRSGHPALVLVLGCAGVLIRRRSRRR